MIRYTIYTPTRGVWVSRVVKTKVTIMASEITHPIEENREVAQTNSEPLTECRTVLDLEGMTCASCAMRIEKGLKKVSGVIDVNVNLATEKASVMYDPTQTNLEQMVQKVEAVGYKATPEAASLQEPAQETAISANTERYGTPNVSISQEDDLGRRRQAEIIRKRNLLILGILLTLPV